MTIFSLSFQGDYPVQEASPTLTFEYLSGLSFSERQNELRILDRDYIASSMATGLFEGSTALLEELKPGALVEVTVWRHLTPSDLAELDMCGFWPIGRASSPDAFIAIVTAEPDIFRLQVTGFIKSVTEWNPSAHSSSFQPNNWSGYFLLKIYGTAIPPGGTRLSNGIIKLAGASSEFEEMCSYPGVLSVAWETVEYPENASYTIHADSIDVPFRADGSRQIINCPSIWEYYQGSGVRIGVLDTGCWVENPDLVSAIISAPPDPDGHGTAVCGVIASRGTLDLGCPPYNGRGVAYDSDLYVLERPDPITYSELDSIFSDFYSAECFLVNNSWGFVSSEYDSCCSITDYWIDSKDMVLIYSAGNGGAPGTITSPGMAKNCVTVGAVTYVPDENGNCYLASYSSQGPTAGMGRLKPDILAPGGAFTDPTMEEGVVTTNAWNGDWLDDPQDRWPDEPNYTRYTGTSMAAAHVSGAVAFCYEKYGDIIHPEDISALIAASAIPLRGNTGDAASGFATTAYGYGLLDAFHMPGVYFSEEVNRPLWLFDTIQEGGPDKEWTFYIPGKVLRLSAALAWSDLPGDTLLHDLTLTLESPGGDSYTYSLPAGVTGRSPLEKICVEYPESGAWIAEISALSWSDPGNPFEEEEYSLVIYTFSREPELTIAYPPADTTIYAAPGSEVEIPVTTINTGGYIAAGTWMQLDAPEGFTGDVNTPFYIGNLVYQGSSSRDTLTVVTPLRTGTDTLMIRTDAANLGVEPDTSEFIIHLAYPDLTVSIPSPNASPPYYVGQVVRFTTVVNNDGMGPSEETDLVYYLEIDPDSSTNTVHTFTVPELQGGESYTFRGSVTFEYEDMGERYLVAFVDSSEIVEELYEDNNRSYYGPFLIQGELAPPENLSAGSGHDGYVPLEWNSPSAPTTDNSIRGSKGLIGYQLYRSLVPYDPTPIATLAQTDTTYTDSLVTNGTTYYYWVTCIYQNPSGESGYSNIASATPGLSGSLSGVIWDKHTGHRLPDVNVTLLDVGLSTMTNGDGEYDFGMVVPIGNISVRVELDGFITMTDSIIIEDSTYHHLDFIMERDLGLGLNVIPNPFTPNSDGINDIAYFIWPAADGSKIIVTIYDLDGLPLRIIEGIEPEWDGLDRNGADVAGGIYVFIAETGNTRMSGVVCLAR